MAAQASVLSGNHGCVKILVTQRNCSGHTGEKNLRPVWEECETFVDVNTFLWAKMPS
jgi:hypothetical protein